MIPHKGDCFLIRKVNKSLKKVKQSESTKSLLRQFDTLPKRYNETTDTNKPKEKGQIEKENREQRGEGEKMKERKRERKKGTLILY